MARTAPAPNLPPIPGMCPGVAILGGGGDGGGGGQGHGGGGAGMSGGGGADPRGAPDYERYPGCGYESHPVDVVTGRAFTHPIVDLHLPGPLPFVFSRMYSAKAADRDVGLGFGWAHTLGWEVEVGRSAIIVWNEQGIAIDFPLIPVGGKAIGPWGYLLRREAWGFVVDADDGMRRMLALSTDGGRTFRLTAVEDLNHNQIALRYEDGRLAEVIDSAGRPIRVRSGKHGRIAAIEVKNAIAQGRWIPMAKYAYSGDGDLVTVTDADGYSARYAHDDRHRLVRDTDRTGLTFHFRYDEQGRCIESWGDYLDRLDPSLAADVPKMLADGLTPAKGVHHCRFHYFDGYTEVANSMEVRHYFGNRHGTLDKAVIGRGVVTCTYDERGFLLARTDERGGTTSYQRDARGRLLCVVDAMGRSMQQVLDEHGLPVEVIDPAGGVTRCERDQRGNPELLVGAAGGVTSYEHDERGLPVRVILANGGKVSARYDAHGNPVEMTQPNGALWRWRYDYLGRLVEELDPLGARTGYSYSDRGDLLSITEPDRAVTRYGYDGEHHLVEVMDPAGYTTASTYGGYHRVCSTRDETGALVRYAYDREGQLVEARNALGEIHRFSYGAAGNLFHETTFDGRLIYYIYNEAGDVVEVKEPLGRITRLTYDLMGDLVKRELDDGTEETFLRDERGCVIHAASRGVDVHFERDILGRVVREETTVTDVSETVELAYDAMGRRSRRVTSRGHGDAVDRDAMGNVLRTRLGEAFELSHTNDRLGREVVRALPGGGRMESAYNVMGRLVQRAAHTAPLRPKVPWEEPPWVGPWPSRIAAERRYAHDVRGAVRDVAGRRGGAMRYAHDPAERLVSARHEEGTAEAYRYDAAGNRYGIGGEPEVYGPGGRILRKGDTEYVWDAAGRLIEKRLPDGRSWSYRWNAKDLPASVLASDGTLVELTYDPFCRRVLKRVSKLRERWTPPAPVEQTRYVWDGDLLVHAIREHAAASGDPVIEERTYCFEDESWAPLAHRDVVMQGNARQEGPWRFYLNNGAGTPEALIGPDGSLVGEIERSAWGMATSWPVGATTSIGFAGQIADKETGLFYHRFRYYDPETGLFISPDPIGFGGGLQTYGYVPDPLGWIDPLGLVKTANMRLGDNLERKRMAELQTPGTEVVSHKVGSNNGIDITVIKRDAQGNVVSVRLEECKANSSRLGRTKHGPQMSDPWLNEVLTKMRNKGGCVKETADIIDDARKAGILEKVVVRGKQTRPGGRWTMFPPKKIR